MTTVGKYLLLLFLFFSAAHSYAQNVQVDSIQLSLPIKFNLDTSGQVLAMKKDGPSKATILGLSINHDNIKAHGGELKVETKQAEETCFTVSIPINQ